MEDTLVLVLGVISLLTFIVTRVGFSRVDMSRSPNRVLEFNLFLALNSISLILMIATPLLYGYAVFLNQYGFGLFGLWSGSIALLFICIIVFINYSNHRCPKCRRLGIKEDLLLRCPYCDSSLR